MLLVRRLPADGAAIVLGQGIAALAVDADGGLVIGQPDAVAGDGVAAAPRRATSPLNSSTPIRRWNWKLSFKTGARIGLLPVWMVAGKSSRAGSFLGGSWRIKKRRFGFFSPRDVSKRQGHRICRNPSDLPRQEDQR